MKKIFILCVFAISFLAGKAQFSLSSGDTITVTGNTSPTAEIVGSSFCKNNGPDTLTLTWQIVSDTMTPGWSYTGFCDNITCYNFAVTESRSFRLLPNASGPLQIDLIPGCNPGIGNVKFLLWNSADSANTVQLATFAINLSQGPTCTNGIAETEINQISIYPNPVRNDLKVTLTQNLSNGQIDIYDLIGSKVFSQPVSTTRDFDMSALQTGIYVARISENGKIIVTKKFTKVD